MLEIVNENSTAYLTVTFKDKDGNAQAPTSATYRIDDVDSGTELRTDTELSVAPSVEITLTPDDNVILDSGKRYEKRCVTVKAIYGASDGVNEEYEYKVKNLAFVS